MVQTGSGLKELIQQAAEKELIVAAEAGVFFFFLQRRLVIQGIAVGVVTDVGK